MSFDPAEQSAVEGSPTELSSVVGSARPVSQRQTIIRNALSNYVAWGLEIALRLVQLGMASRAMGSEGLGLFTLCMAAPQIAQVAGYSLSKGTIRYMALGLAKKDTQMQQRYLSASFWAYTGLGVAGFLVIAAMSPFLPQWLAVPQGLMVVAKHSFLIVAVGVLLTVPLNGYLGASQAAQRYDLISVSRSALLVFQLGVFWLLYHMGWLNVESGLITVLGCRFLECNTWQYIVRYVYPREVRSVWHVHRVAIMALLTFSLVAIWIDAAIAVGYQGFAFLLKSKLTLTEVGAYNVFAMLAGYLGTASRMGVTVLAPVAGSYKHLDDRVRLDKAFFFGTKFAMVIAASVLTLFPAMHWILTVFLGSREIAGYVLICQVLLAGQVLAVAGDTGCVMLAGIGKQGMQATLTVLLLLTGFLAALAVLLFGPKALFWPVVIASAARALLGLLLARLATRDFLNRPARAFYVRAVALPVACAAAAAGVGYAIAWALRSPGLLGHYSGAIGSAVGAVLFAVLVLAVVFNRQERAEVITFRRQKASKRSDGIEA